MNFPMISMRELELRMQRGDPMVLLDLREPEEYAAGHLRGAVNIPYEELEARFYELPMQMPIYVYCARGSQSLLACNMLTRMGYWAADVAGGLNAYRGNCLEWM